jgi:Bifunctional DNA primase/polymerase, N-terminal
MSSSAARTTTEDRPGHSSAIEIALAQVALGRLVFPVDGKEPLTQWTKLASCNPRRVRMWAKVFPHCDFALRISPGFVVVDVDDEVAFAASGRPLIPNGTPQQRTTRGHHYLFSSPTEEVRQGPIPGGDLKVGGKGYVKLYQADAFTGTPRPLPAFYIAARAARSAATTTRVRNLEPMSTRPEILSWVGSMRTVPMTSTEIDAALHQAYRDGRIIDDDPADPWISATVDHLTRIAVEAGKWDPGPEPLVIRRVKRDGKGVGS